MAKSRKITVGKKVGPSPKKTQVNKRGKQSMGSASCKPIDDIFGFFAGKGTITITGDIVSPALNPEEWGDLYQDSTPPRRKRKDR